MRMFRSKHVAAAAFVAALAVAGVACDDDNGDELEQEIEEGGEEIEEGVEEGVGELEGEGTEAES